MFQSTPPRKGATSGSDGSRDDAARFNPRPRARGRPDCQAPCGQRHDVSIHAPAQGGDTAGPCDRADVTAFQSTPPRKGATVRDAFHGHLSHVSIHAPAQGGDCVRLESVTGACTFQSTPPRKGATSRMSGSCRCSRCFNPRPRARGRRRMRMASASVTDVSIHAPAQGGDQAVDAAHDRHDTFQSTPPRKGATSTRTAELMIITCFNPRPRARGRPSASMRSSAVISRFNPRPRARGRLTERNMLFYKIIFFIIRVYALSKSAQYSIVKELHWKPC